MSSPKQPTSITPFSQEDATPATSDSTAEAPRRLKISADKVDLRANELTLVVGTVKLVKGKPRVEGGSDQQIVFDELNEDEFTMRYAD